MEKDLKLIANISIDEECKTITIDKDIQGKALSLKECYAFAKIVGTANSQSGTWKKVRIGYNNIQNVPTSAMCDTPTEGNNAFPMSHAVCMPGMIVRQDAIHKWNFNNSINDLIGFNMCAVENGSDAITSVIVSPGNDCYFGVGSSIRIYGR